MVGNLTLDPYPTSPFGHEPCDRQCEFSRGVTTWTVCAYTWSVSSSNRRQASTASTSSNRVWSTWNTLRCVSKLKNPRDALGLQF